MHPPFFTPDTFVSSDLVSDRHNVVTPKRRSAPQRLRILPVPGWPPLPIVAPQDLHQGVPTPPSGQPAQALPQLHVVPAPRNSLRDAFGRFLIRTGQRMILQN